MTTERMNLGEIRIKIPDQFAERYNSQFQIKDYGEDNHYPQQVRNLIQKSPTGSVCRQRYADFIEGDGFEKGTEIQLNRFQSLNDVHHDIANEISFFGGFALHIRYDGFANIVEIRSIPIETLRLGEDDDSGYFRFVAYCPDWTGLEKTRNKKDINPRKDTIRYFPYSDSQEVTLQRIADAGGAENYAGEILYVSNRFGYPISKADSVLSLLSTEEGLSNICYRNARTSFMPSAIISVPPSAKEEFEQLQRNLMQMQGDQNAMKLMIFERSSDADKPEVMDLRMQNFDREFEVTSNNVIERIYSAYKQEVFYLLRIGKVGFGGQVVADAFNLYNLSVRSERGLIERSFNRLAKKCTLLKGVDFSIKSLVYNQSNSQIL